MHSVHRIGLISNSLCQCHFPCFVLGPPLKRPITVNGALQFRIVESIRLNYLGPGGPRDQRTLKKITCQIKSDWSGDRGIKFCAKDPWFVFSPLLVSILACCCCPVATTSSVKTPGRGNPLEINFPKVLWLPVITNWIWTQYLHLHLSFAHVLSDLSAMKIHLDVSVSRLLSLLFRFQYLSFWWQEDVDEIYSECAKKLSDDAKLASLSFLMTCFCH